MKFTLAAASLAALLTTAAHAATQHQQPLQVGKNFDLIDE